MILFGNLATPDGTGKPVPPKRPTQSNAPLLSVVTPAFNESANLPILYRRLEKSLGQFRQGWEWIVVDDHSADDTYEVVERIARKDKRVKAVRFAKNSGSHLALACGLRLAKGKGAIGMAADLQDPPETLTRLIEKWKKGTPVVWAVRDKREGVDPLSLFLSRAYYFIVRYGLGLKQVPPSGADFFLLDRAVLEALSTARLKNASLLLLISSLPFRQDFIVCDKEPRIHGKSGWNLRKKLKLFFDSVTMFSKAPIYWLLGAGAVFGGISFGFFRNPIVENGDWFAWGFLFLSVPFLLGGIYWIWVLRASTDLTPYSIEKNTFQ